MYQDKIESLQEEIAQLETKLKGFFVANREIVQDHLDARRAELEQFRHKLLENKIELTAKQEFLARLLDLKKSQLERVTNTQKFLATANELQLGEQETVLTKHMSAKKGQLSLLEKQLAQATQAYEKQRTAHPAERRKAFLKVSKVQNEYAQAKMELQELGHDRASLHQRKGELAASHSTVEHSYPVIPAIKKILAYANIPEKCATDYYPQLLANISKIHNIANYIEGPSQLQLPTDEEIWKEIAIGFTQGDYDTLNIYQKWEALKVTAGLAHRALGKLQKATDLYNLGKIEESQAVMDEFWERLGHYGNAAWDTIKSLPSAPLRDKVRLVTSVAGDTLLTKGVGKVAMSVKNMSLGATLTEAAALEQETAVVAAQQALKSAEAIEAQLPKTVLASEAGQTVAGPIETAFGKAATQTEHILEYSDAAARTAENSAQKATKQISHAAKQITQEAQRSVGTKAAGTVAAELEAEAAITSAATAKTEAEATVQAAQKTSVSTKAQEVKNLPKATSGQKGKALAEPSMARGEVGVSEVTKSSSTAVVSQQRKLIVTKDGWRHILEGEINSKGKLTGRHQTRTNPNLIRKITKEPNELGVYEFIWGKDGLTKPRPSTGVPDHWNYVDFGKAVKEAYMNPIEKEIMQRPGVYKIIGRSKSGIAFEIIVDRLPEGDVMRTCYPLYKK